MCWLQGGADAVASSLSAPPLSLSLHRAFPWQLAPLAPLACVFSMCVYIRAAASGGSLPRPHSRSSSCRHDGEELPAHPSIHPSEGFVRGMFWVRFSWCP